MRQLVTALIPAVRVNEEGAIRLIQYGPLDTLGQFLRRNFPDQVGRHLGDMYAYVLVRRIAERLMVGGHGVGPLTEALTAAQREELTTEFVTWWDSVPRTYEFRFPLPQVTGLQLPMQFGPNVELRLEQWTRDGNANGPAPPGQPANNALFNLVRPADVPTLWVRTQGIDLIDSPDESAVAHALHTVKVFMELCYATHLMARHHSADAGTCKVARTIESRDGAGETLLNLPIDICDALRFSIASQPPLAPGEFTDGLAAVGRITRVRERARTEVSRVLSRMQWGLMQDEAAETHTAEKLATRLATAAAWLFDARADDYTANRVVRVAIALEALVGGEPGEGVMSTLKNRLQYGIGESVDDRREIAQRFPEFYRLRSKVVHHGQVRLDEKAHELLSWAEGIVSRALRSELAILPPD